MDSSTTLGFVSISLIPSFNFLSVVATDGSLEDIILVLDVFYLVCYKTKLMSSENFNQFIAFSHNSLLSKTKVQLFKAFSSNIFVSHKTDQISRSWPPQAIQAKITTVILQGVNPLSYFYIQSVSPTEASNQMFAKGSPGSLFFSCPGYSIIRVSFSN